MKRGIFITFEGIEACGKSTQLQLMANWLQGLKIEVLVTREPGGTDLGENIRRLLKEVNKSEKISDMAELLLFEASRSQHVEEKILPALDAGKIVLCDRFYDSTIVYQGAARKLNINFISTLNTFASRGLVPDMTIFLDIPVKVSFERIAVRQIGRDRIEQEGEDFFENVRHEYLSLCRVEDRFVKFDGIGDVQTIHEKIKNEFTRKFFKN